MNDFNSQDTNRRKSNDFLLGEIHSKVQSIPAIHEKLNGLDRKVAKLEVKSSVWGALGGMASGCLLIASIKLKSWFV